MKITLSGFVQHERDGSEQQPEQARAFLIVAPVPDSRFFSSGPEEFRLAGMDDVHPAAVSRLRVTVQGEHRPGDSVTFRVLGPAVDKILLFTLTDQQWKPVHANGPWKVPVDDKLRAGYTVGMVSRVFAGQEGWDGEAILEITIEDAQGQIATKEAVKLRVAPFVLASSLDPVESVIVVGNPRSVELRAALRDHLPLSVKVEAIEVSDGFENDVWVQDAVEIGRICLPTEKGSRQVLVVLPGLRAKHQTGIQCEPLDRAVRSYFERQGALIAAVGDPRAAPDWIDWFGNLEVSPAVTTRRGRAFPLGRILTGRQGEREMHPDVLAFLEAQKVQWPPLVVDTSWLEIGHVDEVLNFVPTDDAPGFAVLFPSVGLATSVLEAAVREQLGAQPVFAGHRFEVTVEELLSEVALSAENRRIQEILVCIKRELSEELGIGTDSFIELPALFRNGMAVIPNMVNSLVVGKQVFAPAPLGPALGGEDAFAAALVRPLHALGLQTHFVDVWDYYHLDAGEIHCGTNAVRRVAHPEWWLQM